MSCLVIESRSMPLLNTCMLLNLSNFAYSCAHSVHERMCLVMTNERLNPDILNKYIFFQSPWQPFQVTWCIDKKSRKEKLHWNDYVTMYVYSKTPLGTRLSQMGKQLHAGAIKPGPGFCDSRVGFFQSVRCPFRWIRVTQALGTRLQSLRVYRAD